MIEIINLTPHSINLFRENGEQVVIEASGTVARCTVSTTKIAEIEGIKVNESHFGDVVGLPAPEEGKVFVVSAMVLTALHGSRSDVFGLSEYVRNEAGQTVGAKALTR